MRKIFPLAAAGLLPLYSAAPGPAPDAASEWVRTSAIRLRTPVAGNGFDDMAQLTKVVGDARVALLGEATHGTREFFQLKHRMLEFLTTKMGFSIFSIEANMPEAYRLNDFVLHGQGDPVKLIKGMYYWTWDTEEVLDMVMWMREFNKSGKGHLEFTGFDMQGPNVPAEIVRDFVARADPEYAPILAHAAELALAPPAPQQTAYGTAMGMFPVAVAAGKTVHFSGYIKTDNVSQNAGLWLRAADSKTEQAAFANLGPAAPTGTTGWQRYELEISIPANATGIYFGPYLAGSGTAWFDDLKVEINGVPYSSDEYDFSFEAASLKGLRPIFLAYPTQLDDQVAHGGKQSLRISHREEPQNPKFFSAQTAAAEWGKVIDHLQASRGLYAKKNITGHDVEWAMQNARGVLQSIEIRGNYPKREPSMAANVKWILDQSPGAKIVVWAHNGHVMTGPGTMGSALRQMYGDKMVVFGFAFNQGSFQAMSSEQHTLKDFTVPAAPAGSLDAMLAASGIPLFALDLRAAPKEGPVAEWLHAAHATRSIGAMYPENSPYAFMSDLVAPQAFDVLLFVEKTTAARELR